MQVNEYLKDVMTQEQKKKETQNAEQTGGPRVSVFIFCSTLAAVPFHVLHSLQTSQM